MMTNEMKLLMAFIEASGFEVEEVSNSKVCFSCRGSGKGITYCAMGVPPLETKCIICHGKKETVNIYKYKVTKKDLSIVLEALDDARYSYPSHCVDMTEKANKAYDIMSDFLEGESDV